MDFYEVVQNRRSVRQYLDRPVEPDKLERIWHAVQAAPSACNFQPLRFLLIRSPAVRKPLNRWLQDWTRSAPLLIVALGNRQAAWRRDGESFHAVDVAIATEHLMLAATAEGLGTCWICAFNRRGVQEVLDLDPQWDPVAVTPLGYPNDPSPRTSRKPLAEIVREL